MNELYNIAAIKKAIEKAGGTNRALALEADIHEHTVRHLLEMSDVKISTLWKVAEAAGLDICKIVRPPRGRRKLKRKDD